MKNSIQHEGPGLGSLDARYLSNSAASDYVTLYNPDWDDLTDSGTTTLHKHDPLLLTEQATPANPSANDLKVYAKDIDGITKLATLDSSGTEQILDTRPVTNGLLFYASFDGTVNADFARGSGTGTLTSNVNIWHFEEGTGTTYANDAGTNNLALGNAPDWTAAGKYGSALDFEATNLDYLTLGDDTDFEIGNNSFSMGLWFKPESPAASNWFFSKWSAGQREYRLALNSNAFDFTISRDGTLGAGAFTNLVSAASYGDTTALHFIVATYQYNATADTSVMTIYYDNAVAATTATAESGIFAGTAVMNLGKQADGANYPDGIIDEPFFIKGTALTAGEVSMFYNNRWWGRTYLDGKFGQGYYAFTGNSLGYTSASNIAKDKGSEDFWFKPTWDGNDSANHVLFDMETASGVNQVQLIKTSGNVLNFNIGDSAGAVKTLGAAVDATNFAKDTWHHLEIGWDSGTMTFRLNGANFGASSGAGTGLLLSLPTTFYVGRDATSQTNEAQGIFDELKIYSRALTAAEIKQNYYATQPLVK